MAPPQRKKEEVHEKVEEDDAGEDGEVEEDDEEGGGPRLRFDQLGLRASQLKLPYYRQSVAEDEERYVF